MKPYDVLQAEFVAGLAPKGNPETLPLTGIEVAFAGRSNVGKSTLINTLVRRKGLVRTSSTPGCTRQINFFSATMRDDTRLVMVDLPGYGFAKRSKAERGEWADLIEGYLAGRSSLRLVSILCDARRGLEEEELELIRFLREGRRKGLPPVTVLLVATKCDKLPRSERASKVMKLKKETGLPIIAFSSEEADGYDDLWRAIRRGVGLVPGVAEPPSA